MAKKTTDDLARLLAAGFRQLRLEAQAQRRSIEQLQTAVVEYSRSVEQRDGLKAERLDKAEADIRVLQQKVSGH